MSSQNASRTDVAGVRLCQRRGAAWLGDFEIVDSNRQTLAYVYGCADKRNAETAKGLMLDEARGIASNIAKLPVLLQART